MSAQLREQSVQINWPLHDEPSLSSSSGIAFLSNTIVLHNLDNGANMVTTWSWIPLRTFSWFNKCIVLFIFY